MHKIHYHTYSLPIHPSVPPSLYPFLSQNYLHILSTVFRSTPIQPTKEVGSVRYWSSRSPRRSYTCNKPINIILLATKQYLYTCSKKEKNPNIMELLFVLHQKYEVEKLVAYKNLTLENSQKPGAFGKPSLSDVMRLQLMLMCKMVFFSNYIFCISINILYILNYDVWAYVFYTLYMLRHWNSYICNMKLPTKINLKKKKETQKKKVQGVFRTSFKMF